jgi:hypothetical protein
MTDDRITYYFVIKRDSNILFKGYLRHDQAWKIVIESFPCSCYIYRTKKDCEYE